MYRKFLLVFLLFSACASIDPAAKAKLDGMIASYTTSSKTFDGATPYKPLPWKEGHWALYVGKDGDKPRAAKYSIVGKEGEGYWLEIHSWSYYTEGISKLLIINYDPLNPSALKIERIISKTKDKKAVEVPTTFMRAAYSYVFKMLEIDVTRGEVKDVTVKAGTFKNSQRHHGVVKGIINQESDVWFNTQIPIFGYLLSETTDKKHVVELVDFGLEGAETEIKETPEKVPSPF